MHLTCRSVPQCWRWLTIASRQTAVLPVFWSPMISSRWPRPMLVIESIALMPVSSGSFTGWRSTTDGACSSSVRVVSASISPLPSSGRPSGSITRPRKPSPTGTDSTRPVWRTSPPSGMPEESPKTMQPISRTSRLRAMPTRPLGNSSSSLAMAEGMPSTKAMPSPLQVTRPTSSRVTAGRYDSTCLRRALAMSSGRMDSSVTVVLPLSLRWTAHGAAAMVLGAQPLAHLGEAAADAAVEDLVADADHHRAQDRRVDRTVQVDRPASDPGEHLGEPGLPFAVELDGGAHLGHQPLPPPCCLPSQLPGRVAEAAPVAQDHPEVGEGGGALAGVAVQQVRDQRLLVVDGQAGVGEGAAHSRLAVDQRAELVQLLLEALELPVGLGGGERRLGGQPGHQLGELPHRHAPLLGRGGEQLDRGGVEGAAGQIVEQGLLVGGGQVGVAERLAQPHLGVE